MWIVLRDGLQLWQAGQTLWKQVGSSETAPTLYSPAHQWSQGQCRAKQIHDHDCGLLQQGEAGSVQSDHQHSEADHTVTLSPARAQRHHTTTTARSPTTTAGQFAGGPSVQQVVGCLGQLQRVLGKVGTDRRRDAMAQYFS